MPLLHMVGLIIATRAWPSAATVISLQHDAMHIIGGLLAAVVGIAIVHFGAWQPWFADTPAQRCQKCLEDQLQPPRIRAVHIGYGCLADRSVRGWRPLPGSIEFA